MATRRAASVVLPEKTEEQFQAAVIELAHVCRFAVYHTRDSRRSTSGFPDLVLLKAGRLIVAEIKRQRGVTTPEQDRWIETFRQVGPNVEAYVWRPSDLPFIQLVLTRGL